MPPMSPRYPYTPREQDTSGLGGLIPLFLILVVIGGVFVIDVVIMVQLNKPEDEGLQQQQAVYGRQQMVAQPVATGVAMGVPVPQPSVPVAVAVAPPHV